MSVWVGAAPISIGHLPISSVSGAAPISIGHLPISLASGTAPISIGHSSCQSESRPHLYRSAIFLSVCVFRVRTAPISIGHSSCQFESRPHLYRSAISLSCQFEFLGPHLYRSVIVLLDWVESCLISSHHLPSFWAFRVVLFTWLLSAHRLFIIALLDFPLPLYMT